jgi:transcriptional regulator with XRE-family HTH domain
MADEQSKKRLGERIRQARLELKMKQGVLSKQLGLTQAVVSNVENGVSTIDVPDLPKWSEALGKPLMYFFTGEEMSGQQHALTALGMVPEDRMEFVLQMIENMALTMRKENETGG